MVEASSLRGESLGARATILRAWAPPEIRGGSAAHHITMAERRSDFSTARCFASCCAAGPSVRVRTHHNAAHEGASLLPPPRMNTVNGGAGTAANKAQRPAMRQKRAACAWGGTHLPLSRLHHPVHLIPAHRHVLVQLRQQRTELHPRQRTYTRAGP
jgi:hypothetical protein